MSEVSMYSHFEGWWVLRWARLRDVRRIRRRPWFKRYYTCAIIEVHVVGTEFLAPQSIMSRPPKYNF